MIIAWIGLAAGAVVLMSFAIRNHEKKQCSGLEIWMENESEDLLFTSLDLEKELAARFGKFESKSIDEVNMEQVISFMRKNPNIDKADAHITIEGKLILEVTQCVPLARIVSNTGQHFYIDEKGKLLPVNPAYPARVIIANGNIIVPLKTGQTIFNDQQDRKNLNNGIQTLREIHRLARMMADDSVMNALVEQVFIMHDRSIRLATKAGSHVIEFGDTSFAEEKFENLKAFYKHGLTKTGWNKYHTISLRYRNQVVCSK
jgi:cell division protein FtsQ